MARSASHKKSRALGRLLVVGAFVGISLATSIQWQAVVPSVAVPGITGDAAGPTTPSTPSAEQHMLEQAATSEVGRQLKDKGYTPTSVVVAKSLVAWLDQQEGKDNVSNPGPYVVFSKGTTKAAKPGDALPDMLVDATHGVLTAVSQTYSNDRGAACYNKGSQDITYLQVLTGNWVGINTVLWHKSLKQEVTVTRKDVPDLPGNVTVTCFTFVPTS